MLGVYTAFERAGRVELLRLMTQQQDDFAANIDTGVIVVVILRRGDAVACEDDWTCAVAAAENPNGVKCSPSFNSVRIPLRAYDTRFAEPSVDSTDIAKGCR